MRLSQVREALEGELPPATLLLGPPSARESLLSAYTKAQGSPQAWYTAVPTAFSVSDVREIQLWCLTPPPPGVPYKLVTLVLDKASEQAQNALLKLLEEPAPTVRFLLLSDRPPLETIVSRCQVLRWQDSDVRAEQDAVKHVVDALKAQAARNWAELARVFRGWTDEDHTALVTWAVECVSYRWSVFSPEDCPQTRAQALRLLRGLSASRPKIADRRTLEWL